jgi:ribosomal protein S2
MLYYTKEKSSLESQHSFEKGEEEGEKHEFSVQKKIKDKDNTLYSNLLEKFHGKPHQNKLPGEKKKTNNSQGSYWLREETELPFIPEALFVANLSVNKILIKEATKLQIPIIGILNNDSNPFGIHYPIPGNNDSAKASALYLKVLIKTLSEGKKKELKQITSKKK